MPLDEALDELYGAAPDDFMAVRSALRGRLREAGELDAAKELARARRPTTAAWVLNQLAREHSELVEDVVDGTRALEATQAHARPGQADEVREAMAARRQALGAAADAAVAIAARITEKAENYRDPIIATLEAGSLDEDGAAALRAGRHVRDTPGGAGFPAASAPKHAARRRPTPAKAAPRPSDGDDRAAAAERERDTARAELDGAEEQARDTTERAEAGGAAALVAEQRVAAAETALEQAKANLRTAKGEARDARGAAQELRRAADAAVKVAEASRRRLTNLGG
ncbi:MAG: hypothetical protein ACRDY6_12545 [Acidimicrobiia bacterium]